MKKICKKCNLEKEEGDFHKSSKNKDGLVIYCKDCRKKDGIKYRENYNEQISERKRNYNINHSEKVKETNRISGKKYKLKNKEKIKQQTKLYRKKNLQKIQAYRKSYKEKNRDRIKIYNLENSDHIKTYKKNYYQLNKIKISNTQKSKYKNDPLFRIRILVRNRIIKFLKRKNISKSSSTFEIIGCNPYELKLHLENLFLSGMTWDNQNLWHIDHIIPLSSAKTEEEIYKLCHFTNLQPLWANDNLQKSNKLNYLL